MKQIIHLQRCEGDVTCWSAKTDSGYPLGTDAHLGRLIETLWTRHRDSEFVLHIVAESEDSARYERQKRDRRNLQYEIERHQREIRYCKSRLTEG